MANNPHEIVRLKDVGRFLGLRRTQRDAIIKAGLLKTFPLSPGGRAKGTTKQSLIEYQQRVMGLSPQPDELTETKG
jgi:hypothetical protein